MKSAVLIILIAFGATAVFAQNPSVPVQSVSVAPSGACSGSRISYLTPNGTLYTCQSGTWGVSGASTPGGISGDVQYNNNGVLGGFTLSGDCTLVVSTGVITCTKTGGVAFSPVATGGIPAAFSTAGKGQYWSPWGTSAPGAAQFTSIGQTLNVMRCIEQVVPAGGVTVSKANSYLSTPDSGKFSGVNWYDVSGNLLGPATTTGTALTTGPAGMSWALGASVVVPAGVNYVCFWSNSTTSVYANSNSGTVYGIIPGVTETSTSNARIFDAAGVTTISGSTITWAASLGNRTVKGNAGVAPSEFIVMDWMP